MRAKSFSARKKTAVAPAIDFRSTGWFDQYLAFRRHQPLLLQTPDPDLWEMGAAAAGERHASREFPLYPMLLHSGLIYGFPFVYPFRPEPRGVRGRREMTKLTLADIMMFSAVQRFQPGRQAENFDLVVWDYSAYLVKTYYEGLYRQTGGTFDQTIGHVLWERVTFRRYWLDWRRSGINCHLFWDWYGFLEFLKDSAEGGTPVPESVADLVQRKKERKWLTLQLIAAAAHSDHQIQLGERVLQHHFVKSAHFFTGPERELIRENFRKGVELDSIELPRLDWMARRYWLDVSLMTLFADKEIRESEEAYLRRLLVKLGLTEEDLLASKLALGGFLMRYGRRLPFFNDQKASLALISKALADNFNNLSTAARGELRETVEMADTFGRLLQYRLRLGNDPKLPSEEEIALAMEQLRDLPKFLPFLSMFFLPVPGITEMYIMLAYSIERLSGDNIRLLPSQFSKMVKRK